ncbi:MAG: peptidylprolyl isomerase [Candidatus Thorarchaeota archaeon]
MSGKIQVKHILIKGRTKAEELIELINTGAQFEQMAREHSLDSSGKKGGNIGFITRGKTVREFEKAAFALKKGEMTQIPVKTKYGWHIIKRVK